MKLKSWKTVLCMLLIAHTTIAQTRWGIEGEYLTKDGKPVYLSGVNYIVSDGWMINLPNLSPKTINADMAALAKIGTGFLKKIAELDPQKHCSHI